MSASELPEPAKQLTIGVLGGMGPQATVDFLQAVISGTPAARDQDHLRLLIDNNPQVPDRQAAVAGSERAVRDVLRDMALGLERQGADFLVMPCNTAHAFIAEAIDSVQVPFVSIIEVTVGHILERYPSAKRLGLLATDACIASGNYQRAVAGAPVEIVVPDGDLQADCMRLIQGVKAGDAGDTARAEMQELAAAFVGQGVDVLIAGCTEIPLILGADSVSVPLISSTDVLAARAVDLALGRVPLPA